MAAGYKHRVIDNLLKRKLQGIGAVLIEGPKLNGGAGRQQRVVYDGAARSQDE